MIRIASVPPRGVGGDARAPSPNSPLLDTLACYRDNTQFQYDRLLGAEG
jgi:hypothetical protein